MQKLLTILFLLTFTFSFGQEVEKNKALARQYYSTGNYEKAAILYEELFNSEKNNASYYAYLFNSLLRLNEYDKLEKIIKKQIKKNSGNDSYLIDLGYVYSQNNDAEKAKKKYEEAIENLTANEGKIRSIAYKFISFRLNEYLVKTYEQGNKLYNNDTKFAYDLGEAYLKLNKPELAIKSWLQFLDKNPKQINRLQSTFSRNLEKDGFQDALETELYAKIQNKPNNTTYPEILIWLFTNQKDFESALIQAKALDKKQKEDGYRILQLAQNAMNEDDYEAAITGYEYLLTKGEEHRYYSYAQSEILKARKEKILTENKYTAEDLLALKSDYLVYIDKYGNTISNANTIKELATLEAKYLDNAKGGIDLIEALLNKPGLDKKMKNSLKLELGDFYILYGDVWEAVLIYEQVNKDERDSPMGEDARFRSAKLSYYNGEFEWAQAQLTVLKGATTELIANDALDLSVFIMDNLGLDTTTEAMEMFSDAELLMIQNKMNEAVNQLTSIEKKFPQHVLSDDILMKKAKIASLQRDYFKAEAYLLDLLAKHQEDILADNATFMLAEIYELHLKDAEKAKTYYEKIITDFSDSVLLVEARKRYRNLRGDQL